MLHFFDSLRVTVLPEGQVVFAVRISDSRVDEYTLGIGVFREMLVAYKDHPGEWAGPFQLQVRVDAIRRIVSLAVDLGLKKEFHRLPQSQFDALAAQFRSQDR